VITRTGHFSGQYQLGDYSDTVAELEGLARWIDALSIKRTGGDRLASCSEDIRRIAEADARGPQALTELSNVLGVDRFVNSVLESIEWGEIYTAFHARVDPHIRDRLARALRGPVRYADERRVHSGSHQGRDYQAELAIAAQLVSIGIREIHFGPDGDSTFHFGGRLVFLETKRPGSEKKLGQRVRDADRQLVRRYAASALDPLGLVGLSVTSVLNPTGGRAKVASQAELEALTRAVSDRFVVQHDRHWHRSRPRTLGALILFRFGAWVESGPHFAPAGCLTFSTNPDLTPDRRQLAHCLGDRFRVDRVRLPGLP
jgi:hypothetical protein